MSLKDLTQDLENFIWTDTTKIGNRDNPQSFNDGKGNIVSGKKSFDRPSKSALEGMESIFGPKYSNVGTRGSYTSVDYMDGTKQGRGFTPPGGPPRGFTVDMGKSEYAIGNPLKYTLTPLSHTIAQMNSSLPYGVVTEQTINDIPISPGAWGDYNVPLASYVSKLDVISDLSIYDSEYDRTLAYIPNITEPDLPLFRQFTRGSGGLNRIDLTSPNFDEFSFIEDIPYVLPQTIFTGPITSPFIPNLFDNTPKLEHAHSIDPISRLIGYPGLYVSSQGDLNETIPQPLYSTPDYGVFAGPADTFDHTEIRSRLYDVYQHHFQPTDINFTNVPLGTDLFGEDELWKGGSIHIGSQDIASGVGGGVSYYGSLIPIVPRGSIYSSGPGGGGYRVPQEGANTLPPGGISNIPKFDGTQITLFGIYNPEDLTSQFSITNQPSGHSYDSPRIPNAYGSDFMTTPIGNSVSQYWPHDYSTSHSLTHIVHMTNQTGPTGYLPSLNVFNVDESGNLIRHVFGAHGSDFMTTPLSDSVLSNDSLTHNVSMISLTGPVFQPYQSTFNIDNNTGNLVSYTPLAHGSDFTTIPINAQSSIFANQSQFLKYTVHEHGFPGITMKTKNAGGEIVDGIPATRDDDPGTGQEGVMYTRGTIAKSIHGGPIFGDSTNNIFNTWSPSEVPIKRVQLSSPNWDPDGNNYWTPPGNLPHIDLPTRNVNDIFGQSSHPIILREIGERWGGDNPIDFGMVRGGLVASIDRGIQDINRITTFMLTPAGIYFIAKQFALQFLNPRPETRLWNPLSIQGSLLPGFHMQRNTMFAGNASTRYGSFDNPLGEKAYWKNSTEFSTAALRDVTDEEKTYWGYGNLDAINPFGKIGGEASNPDASARELKLSGHSQLTFLTNKFLISTLDQPQPGDSTWWSRLTEDIDLGRTPDVPTQTVFSQKGAFGIGKAHIQEKGKLIEQYSTLAYGDIGPGNKYENKSTWYGATKLKFIKDAGNLELSKLQNMKEEAAQKAQEIIDKKPVEPPTTQHIPGVAANPTDAEVEYPGVLAAWKQSRNEANQIKLMAEQEFLNANTDQDKLVAATMVEIAEDSKRAALDVGDQSKIRGGAEPYDKLGLIKKSNGSFNGINTDKVNMIPYGDDYGDTEDFIKFKFKDIVNNKFIIFRALLSGISDTVTPEWEATRFIGRPDDVHVYKGATRKVSFSFDIYPKTAQEFPVLLEKLNFLIGLNYPSFNNNRMVAPFIELTLGDMFNNTPGYIDGVTVTPQDSTTWEMSEGLQFPKHIQVQCDFTYIGKYMPSSLGKHYELNWLKDQGWISDADNSAASRGTFYIKEGGNIRDSKSPERFGFKALFDEIQPTPTQQSDS